MSSNPRRPGLNRQNGQSVSGGSGMKRPSQASGSQVSAGAGLSRSTSSSSQESDSGHFSGGSGPSTPKKSRSQLGIEAIRNRRMAKANKLLPYEWAQDSVVLFEPPVQNAFHLERNPDGIVPVIVHPHFTSRSGKPLTADQVHGLEFLWNWVVREKKGCILAHGMGQGKTLTAIVLLFTLLEQSEGARSKMVPTIKKALVVTPKSILPVWQSQIAEWSPEAKKIQYVAITSGMKTANAEKIIRAFENNSMQVILLSYDSFKKYYNLFRDYNEPLDLAILDEAHYVKNTKARRTEVFGPYLLDDGSGFKPTVKIMVGLTGTPYQNNDEELCNLANFFHPNCLPAKIKEMLKELKIADANAKNPSKKREAQVEGEKKRALKIRKELYEKLKPIIQYKSSRVSGVDKHEFVVCVKLRDGTQQKMYEELTASKTFQGLGPLSKIHALRKICWHPEYACEQLENDPLMTLMQGVAVPFRTAIEEDKLLLDATTPNYAESGKLNFVINLIDNILPEDEENSQKNDKVVVVSYSKDQLDRVSAVCNAIGWSYAKFTGDQTENERKANLDKFRSNGEKTQILLLSSEAGGQGLDLSNANHLILMDPGWTPALDNQIVHRIYRKGQTKDCFVYRILATNTIEEVMFLNQLGKSEIESYYKGNNPDEEVQSGYNPKDLSILHSAVSGSFLKDTIDKINNDTVEEDMEDSIERTYFANELMESKQYANAEEVPDMLESLKKCWNEGVSFVFHKFMGDDGSNVFQTFEEYMEVSDTETESSQGQSQ